MEVQKEVTSQLANPEAVKMLVATTFKGLNPAVIPQAITEGMLRGFNFKDFLEKNIYAIPFKDGYSLVTSIDNNRKIGMRSGIVGTDSPVYVMTPDKTEAGIPKPEQATVTVHRQMANGYVGAFSATVFFDEYYKLGRSYNGEYQPSMWDKKPRTMIAKVAEMHALRKACPEELAQAYVEEEMKEEVKTAPAANLDDSKAKLEGAKDIAELQGVWANLPADAKEAHFALKEEIKKKLTPAAVPKVPSSSPLFPNESH